MINQTISHYKIIEKIGSGGMGDIYKAQDLKLERFVALKFLPPYLCRDETEKKRFIREAKAASATDHENICTIYEIDETEDGQVFIAMAYYEGETLKEKLESGALPLKEAISIAIKVAQGLERVHEEGVIHRDIKTSNIMITNRSEVKILDFGLAKVAGSSQLTKSHSTIGTIAYMSPEQIRGNEIDHRSDGWSLGVVLYEMLSGQQPFKGENAQAILCNILNEEPLPLCLFNAEIPINLEKVLVKCLAKEANARYQNIGGIVADLKSVLNELESGVRVKFVKAKKKRTAVWWGATIVFAVTLLTALFWLHSPKREVVEKKSIAVLPFENLTGDSTYNIYQRSLPNLLITKLEQSQYLQVTTWERMADLLKQLGKREIEIVNIDRNTGFDICDLEGVTIVVTGSLSKMGDVFVIDAKVLDVNSKKILKGTMSDGKGESSIFDQINKLSKDISRVVGLSEQKIEKNDRPIQEVTTSSIEAYNYYQRACADFEKFKVDDARRFFEKAIQLDSTFAMAHLKLSIVYGDNLGLRAMGWEYRDKAIALSNRISDKEWLLIKAQATKDLEEKYKILKQLLERYPKEKEVYVLMLEYYNRTGISHRGRIEFIKKIMELDPEWVNGYNGLAYSYAWMGNYDKAIENARKYANISPGDPNPSDTMGEIYFMMGKFDDAIEKFKEANELSRGHFSTECLSYTYALKENYHEALRLIDLKLKATTDISPTFLGSRWKGILYYLMGRMQESLLELDKASVWADSAGNIYFKESANAIKGWIYFDTGKFDLSHKYFNIDTGVFSNYFYYATLKLYFCFYTGMAEVRQNRIYSAKQKLAEMDNLLTDIKKIKPDPVFELFYRDYLSAEIYLAEGKFKLAKDICEKLSLFKRGLKMPGIQDGHIECNIPFDKDVVARIYNALGDKNKAIDEYKQLITVDLNNQEDRLLIHPKYHYRLAKLYEEKGWTDKAIEKYEKFLDIWKYADENLLEKIDATERLARLKQR